MHAAGEAQGDICVPDTRKALLDAKWSDETLADLALIAQKCPNLQSKLLLVMMNKLAHEANHERSQARQVLLQQQAIITTKRNHKVE